MTLEVRNNNGGVLRYSEEPEYSTNGKGYSLGDMERLYKEVNELPGWSARYV